VVVFAGAGGGVLLLWQADIPRASAAKAARVMHFTIFILFISRLLS
jgi:hypothetical protein